MRLRNLPFKRKLTVINLLTSGTALVLACAAFIAYEQFSYRRDMMRELEIVAQIIGANSASSLSFDDNDSAALTLKSLAEQPHIIRGCLYDRAGKIFASYQCADAPQAAWPTPQRDTVLLDEDSLHLFHALRFTGETIGTIYLQSDLEELHDRRSRYLAIAAFVLLAAMLVTWLIASRLQRLISEPISQLAAIAGRIGAEKAYSMRAIKQGDDEIGRLVDGFNAMLVQIEARDAEIHAAHKDLERRVEERTRSLDEARREATLEKARFQLIFESLPVGVSLSSRTSKSAKPDFLINDAQLGIVGLTREQVLADRDLFNKLTHPDDFKLQLPLRKQLSAGEIDRYSLEKRYIRPDGEIVWVSFSTQRQTYPDGRQETLSVVVDITGLKRAQEEAAREQARFRFIFESLPVGVSWRLLSSSDAPDIENNLLVNPAHEQITGVTQTNSNQSDAFARATHPEDFERQQPFIDKLRRGEIDHYVFEKRYIHPDGRTVWAVLMSRVSTDPATGERQSVTTLVDITERKNAEAELDDMHKQLLRTSHQAGMAEVATGVLHNVGNVLNSVNVSATLVADLVRRSKSPNVGKISDLFDQHRADLGHFLTEDTKGKLIPAYLATLADSLAAEQKTIIGELDSLHKNIGHIKDIVAMQQSYAKTSGVTETISVPDLVEDAIRMNAGSLARHDVEVVREYDGRPVITVEKNKVLQILVNLIRNAKYACDESGRTDKRVTIRTRIDATGVDISVIDNGVGIPPENLTRIFAHGFTTRKHGHGFGLHSGALAAKELGGALSARSEGPGKGATFALRLPFKPVDQLG